MSLYSLLCTSETIRGVLATVPLYYSHCWTVRCHARRVVLLVTRRVFKGRASKETVSADVTLNITQRTLLFNGFSPKTSKKIYIWNRENLEDCSAIEVFLEAVSLPHMARHEIMAFICIIGFSLHFHSLREPISQHQCCLFLLRTFEYVSPWKCFTRVSFKVPSKAILGLQAIT